MQREVALSGRILRALSQAFATGDKGAFKACKEHGGAIHHAEAVQNCKQPRAGDPILLWHLSCISLNQPQWWQWQESNKNHVSRSRNCLNPDNSGIRSGWMAVGVVFISGFSLMGFTGPFLCWVSKKPQPPNAELRMPHAQSPNPRPLVVTIVAVVVTRDETPAIRSAARPAG